MYAACETSLNASASAWPVPIGEIRSASVAASKSNSKTSPNPGMNNCTDAGWAVRPG